MRIGKEKIIKVLVYVSLGLIGICILIYSFQSPRPPHPHMSKEECDIANIETAIIMYETDTGGYFGTNDITKVERWLRTQPPEVSNWYGPYTEGIPKDSWGEEYVYSETKPSSGYGGKVDAPSDLPYYIYSKGIDRKTGPGK